MPHEEYRVLARRYRPQVFRDVVGQQSTLTTLKNALKKQQLAHAYLFCGSRGVGKTTLARILAKALNCAQRTEEGEPCNQCASCQEITRGQSLDVIEIDGASNRGIDDVRKINETVNYAPSHGRFKVYLIDEVHMLTKEAFNALLKTLEEPPENVKFFFATTEPHKLLPTILSRCQRFDLMQIDDELIVQKLSSIAEDMGRKVEIDALRVIASFAEGSLRDAESLFDQILCFTADDVTSEGVRTSLGLVAQEHLFALDQAFANYQLEFGFSFVALLYAHGKDPLHFHEQLVEHVRLILQLKTQGKFFQKMSTPLLKAYQSSADLYTTTQALYLLDYLLRSESLLQKSIHQRVCLEAILLHYIQSKHRVPIEVLLRKVAELEESMKNAPQKKFDKSKEGGPENSTHKGLDLQPAPFLANPLITSDPSPTEVVNTKADPLEPRKEKASFQPIEQISKEVKAKKSPDSSLKMPPPPFHHPSHYDTLLRFTAVELEGTIQDHS